MRRWWVGVVALSVGLAACSGSDTGGSTTVVSPATTTTSEPTAATTTSVPQADEPSPEPAFSFTTVISDDGDLVIQAPDGVAEDLMVETMEPEDWPAPLQGAAAADGVTVYDLGPSGTTFAEPVRVSRRLDLSSFSDLDLGPTDMPLVTLLTTREDGTYELLDDLVLVRRGNEVWVSGTTTHFSPVLASNEGVPVGVGISGERVEPSQGVPGVAADDPILKPAVATIGAVDIFFPSLDPAEAQAIPIYADSLGAFPVELADVRADDSDERDAAGNPIADPFTATPRGFDNGTAFDSDYNTPYLDEMVIRFESQFTDDLAVAVSGYRQRIKVAALPSTSALLTWSPEATASGAAPDAINIGFGIYIVSGQRDPNAPATGVDTLEAAVAVSTFHTQFGGYSSSQRVDVSLTGLDPNSDSYWVFNYKDPPISYDATSPQALLDSQVIGVSKATIDGDLLSAVVGIDCYCDYGYGLLQVPAGASPPSPGELSSLVETGNVSIFADSGSTPLVVGVSATEGEVFQGDVAVVGVTP